MQHEPRLIQPRRRRAGLLALAVLLCVPPQALAAPGDATWAQAAEEQFREGREAFKAGDIRRALDLFRKSQELYPATGTLLNLAICEARLGMLLDARKHLKEVIGQLAENDERRAVALKEQAAVEKRVPRLKIELKSGAEGATVTLDGGEAPLDEDVPLDPGQHVVEVKAPGRETQRYEVALEEGIRTSLAVSTDAPIGGTTTTDTGGGIKGRTVAGIVLGGIGIAGLGVGAVTGIMALNKKSEVQALCPDPAQCTTEGVEIAQSGKTLSIVSTVGLGVGILGVGAGAFLLLTGGDDDGANAGNARERGRARAALGVRGSLSAAPLPGGGMIGVRGSF